MHSVVVQFEDSGKWPVEREAVCKLKAAFLVAMKYDCPVGQSLLACDLNMVNMLFWIQIK